MGTVYATSTHTCTMLTRATVQGALRIKFQKFLFSHMRHTFGSKYAKICTIQNFLLYGMIQYSIDSIIYGYNNTSN